MSNDTPENTEKTGTTASAGSIGGGGYGEPTPEQELGGQGQRKGEGQGAGSQDAGQDAGESPTADVGQRADADEVAAEERDPGTDPAAPPPIEPAD